MSVIERRRDTFGGPRPMDLDNRDTDHHNHHQACWWGGAETCYPMSFPNVGMRRRLGKRRAARRFFKCSPTGDKKGREGVATKGKGNGKGNSVFECERHWCGQKGHSASRCNQTDEYLDNLRKKGGSKEQTGTYSMEEEQPSRGENEGNLGNVERKPGGQWRTRSLGDDQSLQPMLSAPGARERGRLGPEPRPHRRAR